MLSWGMEVNDMENEKENKQKLYGYARVSTVKQKEDRQVIALKEMGVPEKNIYIDKMTGKHFNRPQYKKLLKKLNENSVLVVKSIDRLGRSYQDLLKRAEYHVHISDMGVDECPLTDSEYKTEQPSGCFHLPSQQSSCCSRTEAKSSIS